MFSFLKSNDSRAASSGFTLIEVILSIAIIGVLTGMLMPVFQTFQNRNDLDVAAFSMASALRRAQSLSRAMISDESWGVHIASSTVTVFQGSSFASRNTLFDETSPISGSIVISGINEVVFSKFSGSPDTTGTTTLTSVNNEIRHIGINEEGTVL